MDTSKLKKFAQFARRSLIEQVQTKLKLVLAEDSLARRESPKAVKELENKKQELGEEQLLEQVAYTWFNRFCALRFMDANQYNRIMVVSPVAGQFQPEILAEAKAGHLDDSIFNEKTRDEINGLLSGSTPSRDGQSEAYRLMIVAVCNDYHRLMPYLFERIEDYTELLMPDDLLSGNSILAYTREAMTPENCESVESIGWLYQFYISEKKDQVFEGLKKNKKITPENIPAATQLFTPHWIVRYLVENSLGRLWMLNNPNSKVIDLMDYYIKPAEEEKDYLKISSPEELKICDPACGSGHMLTYAYDLLYAIYLDAGYDSSEIPEKILTNNLYGIEIDERAAELAAFALSMKALKGNPLDESNNRRRFFRRPVEPKICHIEKVTFSESELDEYFAYVGIDLFTDDLKATFEAFEEADNFGSLIQPKIKNSEEIISLLDAQSSQLDLFLADTHRAIMKVLKQTSFLSDKYQIVLSNPPYLGSGGMNPRMRSWVKEHYPLSKADLFAVFIERCLEFGEQKSFSAMITMQSWMFLSSFEKFRVSIINSSNIDSLIQIGYNSFPELNSKVAQACAFVLEKNCNKSLGSYIDLNKAPQASNKQSVFEGKIHNNDIFQSNKDDFNKIVGTPISYWITKDVFRCFESLPSLKEVASVKNGMSTTNNDKFTRLWFEVEYCNFGLGYTNSSDACKSGKKWFPYNKGGLFRRWYGNFLQVVNWKYAGKDIKKAAEGASGGRIVSEEYFFKKSLSWSKVSTGKFAVRSYEEGSIFDVAGPSIFCKPDDYHFVLGALNSHLSSLFIESLSPTINYEGGQVGAFPINLEIQDRAKVEMNVKRLIEISQSDWNAQEISWKFRGPQVLLPEYRQSKLSESYCLLENKWAAEIEEFLSLEKENSLILSQAYNLDCFNTNELNVRNISLNVNPYYRYTSDKTDEQLQRLLKNDVIIELVSYFVGCIFGRYSLDKEGLIIANQGDTLEYYQEQAPQSTFVPDRDNVIPLIDFDGDWFEDDIAEHFKHLLKVAFGREYFTENLEFIESAIGKDIKKYFVKDFYADHVKRYKKRPIYWMFSSPKGTFSALIYMHRYTKDTVDVVLNNYLREFRTKLLARKESLEQIEISASASQKDKTQAIKTIAKINKVLDEINDYEHDVLYPLAGEKVEIDLDDGVKHNYPLFGKALKKVPGLS